jgi:hypothetical protein
MAKKSRRTRSTPRLSASQLVGARGATENMVMPSGAARRAVADAPRSSLAREDYSHVRQDLKRIAVLAASFITVMVILSFVLPQIMR